MCCNLPPSFPDETYPSEVDNCFGHVVARLAGLVALLPGAEHSKDIPGTESQVPCLNCLAGTVEWIITLSSSSLYLVPQSIPKLPSLPLLASLDFDFLGILDLGFLPRLQVHDWNYGPLVWDIESF